MEGILADNGPSKAYTCSSWLLRYVPKVRKVRYLTNNQIMPPGQKGLTPQSWSTWHPIALFSICSLGPLSSYSTNLNQSSSSSSISSTSSSSSTATGDSVLATAPLPLLLFAGLCCVETAALSPTKSLPVQSVWHRGHFLEL